METFLTVFLLAVLALIFVYVFLDWRKRDKKGRQDPAVYIEGLRAMLSGHDETAFARFRDVVAEDSGNIDAYIRLGDLLRKYNKADKALQVHKDLTLRQDITRKEKRAVLESLAEDYTALKDDRAAMLSYKELLELEPNHGPGVRKLLEVQARLGNWEEAYQIKERLIKIDREKSRAGLAIYKFFQGQTLYDQKKYHKSRIVFKEAISIDPGCVPAYIWIGDSYLAEDRLEDAATVWRKLIKAVPEEAHLVLGRLQKTLFDLGRFGEISDVCKEILEGSGKNLEAWLTLADYHYKKGEYALAIEHLNRAADNYPDSYLPPLELARLYLVTDEKQKLRELLDRLESGRESRECEYLCRKCGHKSGTKLWLCPSCKAVDSFRR